MYGVLGNGWFYQSTLSLPECLGSTYMHKCNYTCISEL